MDKFMSNNPAADTGLLTYVLSSPWWAPMLHNFNEFLTTLTLLAGLILAGMRIATEIRNRRKKDK